MSIKQYRIPLIISIILALVSILPLFLLSNRPGYMDSFPIDNFGAQVSFTSLGMMLFSIIGGLFMGYILGPFFLWMHKLVIGRKMIYGIQETIKPEKFKGYTKGIFPALMAMNIAIILAFTPEIQSLVTTDTTIMGAMLTFSAVLPIASAVGMAIFSPVWFLLEIGVVYTNKRKASKSGYPIEVRSVGGWYQYLLKGYAGISVIFNYYTFFSQLISEVGGGGGPESLMFIISWPLMPLIMSLVTLPAFMLLDCSYDKRKKYMRKITTKLRISEPLENPLDKS